MQFWWGAVRLKLAWIVAGATFGVDQLSKLAVVQGMKLIDIGVIDVWPPYLTFRMAWNQGVNFGLMAGQSQITRWALIVISLAITLWVWRWVSRTNPGRLAQAAAGLLIGGALGNVIDRVVDGAVADFLNMSCCGIENPYAFNVADIAIFAGALGLVLFTGKDSPKSGGAGKAKGKPAAKRGTQDGKTS